MLSLVTREDRLAIFQKLTPVSFYRLFRKCKWANQFIEDNKHKIKIRIYKDLSLTFEYDHSNRSWRDFIVIMPLRQRTTIPNERAELEPILSDARFQCFVFECVYLEPPIIRGLAEYPTILEPVPTIATRKLSFNIYTGVCLPTFLYNCEHLQIINYGTHMLDATFDLVETQRSVYLRFCTALPPVNDIAGRCCELMRKIMGGRVVTKKLTVEFVHGGMEQPAVLDRFFREKESETVVLVEGAKFQLIPVSQRSFLAAQWSPNKWHSSFDIKLIESKETFYQNCNDRLWDKPNTLTADELLSLPVVQQICNRFFS